MLVAFVLAGCTTTFPMMPTPVLYTGPRAKLLFTEAPEHVPTASLDLLFVTDRAPATSTEAPEPYTADRSRSMAFGATSILFGEGVTWDALVQLSTLSKRPTPVALRLGQTREIGRFPPIPYEVTETAGGLTRAPAALEAHDTALRALQAEVAHRLASSPRKEVVLFVHGYQNTFQDAALTMGELCHFLGREFVCGIFTWPAGGRRGILFGYNVDYESSVFAVEHLRKAIRTIATTPGVERVHLLAHSRGTDVLVSAVSELNVEAYTQQDTVSRRYKLGNIVLMAPDLDIDVAVAKMFKVLSDPDIPYGTASHSGVVFAQTPEFRITIYVSPHDKALAASSWLFGSIGRLGRLGAATMTPHQIEQVRMLREIDVIEVREGGGWFGHSYFTSNHLVSADLIAMLRYGLRPNEPGRPLEEIERPFWRVSSEHGASPAK
jgi:esterase/lipase superfamily enzyme